MQHTLLLTSEQAQLLHEMLSLPQLTITFPKAKMAAELYASLSEIMKQIDTAPPA